MYAPELMPENQQPIFFREYELNLYAGVKNLITPPQFHDDEQNRIAGILYASAVAILSGLSTLVFYRLALGQFELVLPFLTMGGLALASIVLVRRGLVDRSANLMAWALLCFLNYLIVMHDGIHDTAVLSLPGVLVLAGLALKKKNFLFLTAALLLSIGAIGAFEVAGIIHNTFSDKTVISAILDIVVILGIIALTVRLLSDNLLRSFSMARKNEKAIRETADQLKEAEKTLRESEERFRTLYENSTIGLYRTTPEGKVVLANPTLVKMLGYSSFEELTAKGLDKAGFEPSYDRKHFIDQIEASGKITDLESTWTRKDGSMLSINETALALRDALGKTLYYDGTVEDITGRKKTEAALQKSEEKYRRLLENMNEVVMSVDNDDRVLFVNRRFTELFGYEPQEIIGRIGYETLLDEKNHDIIKKANSERKNLVYSQYEVEFISKNGEKIPFLVSGSPLFDNEQHVIGSIGTFTDISDRKRLEQQLIQAQKLEGVGTLAGGIAHDFNNLLAMVLGSAELLQHHISAQPELKKYVDRIVEASERGKSISRQLLIFSRPDQVKLEPISLAHTITGLQEMLRHFLPKSITIATEMEIQHGIIMADSGQIHQALLNLALNAGDAMTNQGTLTFKEHTVSPEFIRARFSVSTSVAHVAVSVSDTGVGMDEALIARIFDPFFSTKGPGKGTGLGLAMVHGIVKNHNGFIGVVSAPGEGTTFTLYFPAASCEVPELPAAGIHPEQRHTGTILLVDDEECLRELLSEFLSDAGYTVHSSCNGTEALEYFRLHGDAIDLVITDLGMPGMGGEELFGRLKEIDPGVKVMISSGYLDRAAKEHMLQLGISAILKKPYPLQAIHDEIINVLGH